MFKQIIIALVVMIIPLTAFLYAMFGPPKPNDLQHDTRFFAAVLIMVPIGLVACCVFTKWDGYSDTFYDFMTLSILNVSFYTCWISAVVWYGVLMVIYGEEPISRNLIVLIIFPLLNILAIFFIINPLLVNRITSYQNGPQQATHTLSNKYISKSTGKNYHISYSLVLNGYSYKVDSDLYHSVDVGDTVLYVHDSAHTVMFPADKIGRTTSGNIAVKLTIGLWILTLIAALAGYILILKRLIHRAT